MIILRGAVKQVCRRMGLLASFMAKPALPTVYSSGWHLHQSLFDTATGRNAFAEAGALMSNTGLHFVGGLLEHARAATADHKLPSAIQGANDMRGPSPGEDALSG
jgi:glutamine synthetase